MWKFRTRRHNRRSKAVVQGRYGSLDEKRRTLRRSPCAVQRCLRVQGRGLGCSPATRRARFAVNATLRLFTNGSLSPPRLHAQRGDGEPLAGFARPPRGPGALSMRRAESPKSGARERQTARRAAEIRQSPDHREAIGPLLNNGSLGSYKRQNGSSARTRQPQAQASAPRSAMEQEAPPSGLRLRKGERGWQPTSSDRVDRVTAWNGERFWPEQHHVRPGCHPGWKFRTERSPAGLEHRQLEGPRVLHSDGLWPYRRTLVTGDAADG